MKRKNSPKDGPPNTHATFPTTQWSRVLEAGDDRQAEVTSALAELCETYWSPVYAYIRRLGRSSHDAEELTQEFLARILERNPLGALDPSRGRFRTFLAACLRNFLAKEWAREHRKKRGGNRRGISFDASSEEERSRIEPAHELTAERLFEHRWAQSVLDASRASLRREFEATEKGELFDRLRCYLETDGDRRPYDLVARDLSMTETAVKVAVHRLRRRYGEIVREEVRKTLASAGDVDDELATLMLALRRS